MPGLVRGGRGQVIGATLVHRDQVLVVVAEGRGPGQHPDVAGPGQPLAHRVHPGERRLPADLRAVAHQAAAQAGLLIHQDDPPAAARGAQGGAQPRRPPADHEHIAVRVAVRVGVGIGLSRRPAQPRGLADEVLVEAPPAPRPHEGLVVEAGGQQARGEIVDRTDVAFEGRPAVLARAREPVEELHLGGAQVGLGPPVPPEADQRVGLLGAGPQDAARAVVLEAAPHHPHSVGEQGRGDAVARVALAGPSVEGEAQGPASEDEPAAVLPERLAHAPPSPRGWSGRADPCTSWVQVSRLTLNQRRQPWP